MNDAINLLLLPFYFAGAIVALVAIIWYMAAVMHSLTIIALYIGSLFGQDNKSAISEHLDGILCRGGKDSWPPNK